jgi:thiol-disulfide isomerase/thioredoxin
MMKANGLAAVIAILVLLWLAAMVYAETPEPAVPEAMVWSASWCPHCPTYKAESIDPLARAGYVVHVWDADHHRAMASAWRVSGLPCTILYAPDGRGGAREIGRLTGKVAPEAVELIFRLAGVRRVKQ